MQNRKPAEMFHKEGVIENVSVGGDPSDWNCLKVVLVLLKSNSEMKMITSQLHYVIK